MKKKDIIKIIIYILACLAILFIGFKFAFVEIFKWLLFFDTERLTLSIILFIALGIFFYTSLYRIVKIFGLYNEDDDIVCGETVWVNGEKVVGTFYEEKEL